MAKKTRVDAYGILDPQTGEVKLYNREEFRKELSQMNDRGSEKNVLEPVKIKVTVRRTDVTISNKQRRYFFGVIAKLILERLRDYGNTRVDLDGVVLWLKDNFLYREILDNVSGKIIKKHISLSDNEDGLTKEEFQKAKEEIQQFCAQELELQIPDPGQEITSET